MRGDCLLWLPSQSRRARHRAVRGVDQGATSDKILGNRRNTCSLPLTAGGYRLSMLSNGHVMASARCPGDVHYNLFRAEYRYDT